MLKNVNNDYVKNVQPDLYCQLCDMAIQQYVYVWGYIFNKVTWVNMVILFNVADIAKPGYIGKEDQ